jgi:hypothetical protein
MNESRLKTALTVLPVLSAGLYLMGATYHQGYLDAFGLDDSQFPLATDKSLLSGFLALVTFGLTPMLYSIFAILALCFTVLVAAVLSSHPRVKHWQSVVFAKLSTWRVKNAPSEAMNNLVDKSATFYGYSVGIFLLVFLLLVVAVLSGKSGREQATKEMRSFKDGQGNFSILYSPQLPEPTRTRLIICSQSHCAFWLGKESLVLRNENIERVLMHNPAVDGTLRDKAAQRPSP